MTTKQAILKEATTLFSELGYKGTSVRKIASKVGIRESALYNHFKNKEEIFLTIAADIFTTPLNINEASINDEAKRGKAFLSKYAMQFKLITFDKKSEMMFRLLLIELFSNEALRKKFISEFHDKNIKLLSQGFFIMMQEGLISSNDPMLVAYEFLSTLFYIRFQVTLLRFDTLSTDHISTQIEKHVDFFWESIKI
ncbi:MAG: TetR/AcrR family transcriptional regulator [Epsilonproteobacteria bacterium]|nr:TetR/AcrR family transcriptional regulator [Campylobacterota bacterium]